MDWFQNALLNIPSRADFVDKTLRGTKPADIRVEQPTKFDLMVNLNRRQGARSHRAADATRCRRRGDRESDMSFVAVHELGFDAVDGSSIGHVSATDVGAVKAPTI